MPALRTAALGALLLLAPAMGPCDPTPVTPPPATPTPGGQATPTATAPSQEGTPTAPGATPGVTPTAAQPTDPPGPHDVATYGGLKEATNATCSDGVDNDANGYLDCADFGCRYTASVTVCGETPSAESTNARCADRVDNDGDGYVDCADYDCQWNGDVTVCDRDGDGASPQEGDCFDHPNLDISRVVGPDVPEMCGDGEDNDCDGVAEEVQCIQLHLGPRVVDYVIDGDTVELVGLGRVRLLGIDTPEATTEVECYGPEAKAFTQAELDGQVVDVWVDPFDWEDGFKDLYGRWLGHLYKGGVYHNGALAAGGYACAYGSIFPTVHTDELVELEEAARASGAGLWGACAPNAERVCF